MKISVVIPASGIGTRFGGETPKQFLELNGEPVLKRTLSIFDSLETISEIAVAVPEGFIKTVEDYKIPKLKHIVIGNNTRAESIYNVLTRLSETDIVLIHDGVRPFVTHEIIKAVALTAKQFGAAVACSPVTDTIKQVDSSGTIVKTPERDFLWQAQTPQGFTYEIILRAYSAAKTDGVLCSATDDSALVERIGIPVKIVPSSPANIKITTQTDLKIAECLL